MAQLFLVQQPDEGDQAGSGGLRSSEPIVTQPSEPTSSQKKELMEACDLKPVTKSYEQRLDLIRKESRIQKLISSCPPGRSRQLLVVQSMNFYDYVKENRSVSGLSFSFVEPVCQKESNSIGYNLSSFSIQIPSPGSQMEELSKYGVPFIAFVELKLPRDRKGSVTLITIVPVQKIFSGGI